MLYRAKDPGKRSRTAPVASEAMATCAALVIPFHTVKTTDLPSGRMYGQR